MPRLRSNHQSTIDRSRQVGSKNRFLAAIVSILAIRRADSSFDDLGKESSPPAGVSDARVTLQRRKPARRNPTRVTGSANEALTTIPRSNLVSRQNLRHFSTADFTPSPQSSS